MPKKSTKRGMITAGILAGMPADLLRTGMSFTVRLCTGRGAYAAGDIVSILAVEFALAAHKEPKNVEDGHTREHTHNEEQH